MKNLKVILVAFLLITFLAGSTLHFQSAQAQVPILTNLLWTQAGEEANAENCEIYADHNMTGIIIQAGAWGSDLQIHQYPTDQQITDAYENAHDNNMKLYVWFTAQSTTGYGTPDLTSSSQRSDMVAELVSWAQNHDVDGVDDDLEEFAQDEWSDTVAYWNAADNGLNAIGKEYFASTYVDWLYGMESEDPGLTLTIDVDSVNIMMYGGNPHTEIQYKEYITDSFDLLDCPIHFVMRAEVDIYFPFREGDGGSFGEVLTWYDETLPELPVGFSIFWVIQMTPTQWTAWDNWSTKNNLVTLEPTPTPTPTASPSPTPTPSPSPSPIPATIQTVESTPVSSLFYYIILCVALVAGAIVSYLIFPWLGFGIGAVGIVATAFFAQSGQLIISQSYDALTNTTTYQVMPIGWFLLAPIILCLLNLSIPLLKRKA